MIAPNIIRLSGWYFRYVCKVQTTSCRTFCLKCYPRLKDSSWITMRRKCGNCSDGRCNGWLAASKKYADANDLCVGGYPSGQSNHTVGCSRQVGVVSATTHSNENRLHRLFPSTNRLFFCQVAGSIVKSFIIWTQISFNL